MLRSGLLALHSGLLARCRFGCSTLLNLQRGLLTDLGSSALLHRLCCLLPCRGFCDGALLSLLTNGSFGASALPRLLSGCCLPGCSLLCLLHCVSSGALLRLLSRLLPGRGLCCCTVLRCTIRGR